MHFFVHSAALALAPLAPHFESETYPFTVVESAANATLIIMTATQRTTRTSSSFLIVWISFQLSSSVTNRLTMPGNYITTGEWELLSGCYLLAVRFPGAPGGGWDGAT